MSDCVVSKATRCAIYYGPKPRNGLVAKPEVGHAGVGTRRGKRGRLRARLVSLVLGCGWEPGHHFFGHQRASLGQSRCTSRGRALVASVPAPDIP